MSNESGVLAKNLPSADRRLKVLFVDDHPESARVMARTATALGNDAAWASTEAEARALLSAQQFDGVVTDYALEPEAVQGGGGRVAAMLHSGGRDVPCVVITGFSPAGEMASVVSVLEALGNVVVLHKPQEPQSLLSILRSLIDARTCPPQVEGAAS